MKVKYYNPDKLERAKVLAGLDASEEAVLAAYQKMAGKYEVLVESEVVSAPEVSPAPIKEKRGRKPR